MRRSLVTGGAGFLGSHLCTRLVEDGHHVICLDNFQTGRVENVAHLMEGDLARSFELIRHDVVEPYLAEIDEIYHLACPASPPRYQHNPVRTLKTAVLGTMNMLELARDTGARILISSTSEIYGEPLVHPQREDHWGHVNPIGKRSCYDEGKRCGESLAVAYAAHHGVDARLVRIFNTYGPRMQEDDGRVVPTFIHQALRGEPLTVYGDGLQTRSLCYQSDLIEGLVAMMAMTRAEGGQGPVNLGNPTERTVLRIARIVLELTGSSSPIEHRPLPADDPTRRLPDISRARARLGWEPRVSLEDGLAATIEYFRARLPSRGNGRRAPARAKLELYQ
ncbi:MAG TPA: UDP-glucuronic acid decarboxylase family protein [Kofleriaceae bacterium]|nr:UDP-glucuronic acid decarboxylase family protein [Kofleriaceae bacterium]